MYFDEEEECEIYIPGEDPNFKNNTRGRNPYRPRGSRVLKIFPQSYSTRGQSSDMAQKSSVRVIYDDPFPQYSNRGKFKPKGRHFGPRNKNPTSQFKNEDKLIKKDSTFSKVTNNDEIQEKSGKSTANTTVKTKFFSKTKGPVMNNKPIFPETNMFNEQPDYSSKYEPPTIGHPIVSNFQSRGSKYRGNNHSFSSYDTFLSYDPNYPMYRPDFSSDNIFKYPRDGYKFYSDRPRFPSSRPSNKLKFQGSKISKNVSDFTGPSCTIQYNDKIIKSQNEMVPKEPKTTTKKKNSNFTKIGGPVTEFSPPIISNTQATKASSDATNSSNQGSTNSLNEPKEVDQVPGVSDTDPEVTTTGVVTKKKKPRKKKIDIDDLITKARAIAIIEQKISPKPFIPQDLSKNNENTENNTNYTVYKRPLTEEQKEQEMLREWEKQLEERIELNRKDTKKQIPFVGYYGVTLSKDDDNPDDTDIFYGQKMSGKDRARGGCRRGAFHCNKGGHSQRQIYEFKFARVKTRGVRRI